MQTYDFHIMHSFNALYAKNIYVSLRKKKLP